MRAFAILTALPWMAAVVVADPAGQGSAPVARATVVGTVYDSIGRRPLIGAQVQFVGAALPVLGRVFTATTDSAGRYTLADVPPGRFVAGFLHPVLDTLGLEPVQVSAVVEAPNHVVPLATPSPATLALALCPAGTYGDSLGVLLGHVLDARTGAPLPGAVVTARWNETVIGRGGIWQRAPEISTVADSIGRYGMCLLPAQVPLLLRAVVTASTADSGAADRAGTVAADSSGYVELELESGGVRGVRFLLGGSHTVTVMAADTVIGREPTQADTGLFLARRGEGRVAGIVRDAGGQPAPDARVHVWGTARQARTNARGEFRLDSLPGGTHQLEVRAIGFVPVREIVHISAEGPPSLLLSLGQRAVSLPTMVVRSQLVYSRKLQAFEDRRRKGFFGHFLGPEEIENRPFARVSQLVSQIPGVQSPNGGNQILMRNNKATYDPNAFAAREGPNGAIIGGDGAPWKPTACEPTFFVDGRHSFLTTAEVDAQYEPHEIAAVEVYTREANVPMEFQTNMSRCGVVALWIRPPPMRLKKK